MRKLIIAVLVLISLDSFAQPTNYTWYKQRIRQYSLMLDSMLYIPRYNGTPSGVRANENSAIDGAIAVDTANHRVYIYSGNAWRRLANYSELGVDSIWREAGKDSIFWSKGGSTYKIKDSTGGGGGGSQDLQDVTDIGATTTNAVQVGTSLTVQGGNDPFVSIKQATTNQEYRLRVGVGTGLSSQSFSLYDATAAATRMVITTGGHLVLGRNDLPAAHSRVLVYGGSNGSNIDALPDSTQLDESNIEVMGADYYGASFTGYGVAMQFNGNANTGSVLGYSKKNFGQLRFTGVTNFVRVTTNSSLRFATNNTEKAVLDSNGRFGINVISPSSLLHVNDSEDNTGYVAQFGKAGVLKAAIGTEGNIYMVDMSAPSTPSSGYGTIYVRTDSLRFKNDAGTEFTLGSGGGGGSGITVGTTTITSGTNTRVGFNDGGVYGEDAGLAYDKTTDILSIGVAANVPTIYGGTGTTSDLNLKTTTGVGTTGADMHFLVGNNGGTEAMTILNSGAIGFDNTSPSGKFHFVIPSGSEATTAWTTDNFVVGASGGTGAGIGITRNGSSITMQALAPNTAWQDLKIKSGTGYWYGGGANLAFHIGTTGNMGIGTTVTTDRMNVNGSVSMISGRHKTAQGADVASAAGEITLGSDGNVFEITGTSSITAIVNTNWQNGATITLLFTSTATLVDGTANSGTSIGFELEGNTDFVATADDVITLVLSEIGGTQRWREVSRSVN